jgi:phytoene dehydrogenase-like protein
MTSSGSLDAVVVGAGINGLVCALTLANNGLSVLVVEDKPAVGGVNRTEFPFARAPRLGTSTGAHRIGFVPRVLSSQLGLTLPLAPREPSMFVPTTSPGRYLLAGAGHEGLRRATGGVVTDRDAAALGAMHAELDALVADLEHAWAAAPLTLEEIAERYVRQELRTAFVSLCRGSFAEYAARFGIQSGLVKAALAADSLAGSFASWDTPGSGGPLLVRHAATSLQGGGDAVVAGGLGALGRTLAEAAQAAGVRIVTGRAVTQIVVEGNTVTGLVYADGTTERASVVIASADPWRLRALVGAERLPPSFSRRIDGFARPGGIAKLNLALSKLPAFACLPTDEGQHRATTFLLPCVGPDGEDGAVRAVGRAFADANAGRLPLPTPVECVFPTAGDEGLSDAEGHHAASLLVPWVPYDLAGTTWSAEEERFTKSLLDLFEAFAPGVRSLVVEATLYHPKKIETHFGLTRGHLGHVDDTHLFGDRLPPATPITGLYTCGRGCSPAGGVLGVAGYNAARRVVSDFELALERTEVGIRL